ncbi:Protein of unknown function (DUF2523) [Beggiatoa alba B18LD]|uniref:DUF2523 domain-containing protein n=1 Tax=Beggiatoa alba B18LD TaxID=395493 RepID=I3CE09_9GAMM|nr:DUF2523 family protein [Beggiatoa alba]EIJ41852.1 Protein of unknown function (DUF2523) [Beggiatoa alba B18LD]
MSELLTVVFNKIFSLTFWAGLVEYTVFRVFMTLGLSVATYNGIEVFTDELFDLIVNALHQLDGGEANVLLVSLVAVLDYLGIFDAFALIFSAHVAMSAYRWSIVRQQSA